jgi:serine protease Do
MQVGEMKTASARGSEAAGTEGGKLGLALRPLSGEEKAASEDGVGLAVEAVSEGPAARAGIRRGDVIVGANGEALTSPEQLKRLADRGKNLVLLVQRGERRIFVPIRIG